MLLHRQHSQMGAARARRAELRLAVEAVTPPEQLPSWQWFNPRRMAVRRVTEGVAGDPVYTRSALGGFVQHGTLWDGDDGFQHPDARMKPSNPQPLSDRVVLAGRTASSPIAAAVATVHGCRFPIGEVFSGDFHFCNEERTAGPYCALHAEICFLDRGRRL